MKVNILYNNQNKSYLTIALKMCDKGIILKILVVDDDGTAIKMFRYLCESVNAKDIDDASDGVQAVEKCKTNSYDLIFMDIKMPIMDGLEATKAIREFNSNVEIIMTTSEKSSNVINEIKKSGANDYIAKPLNSQRIKQIVAEKLQKAS